MGQQLSNLMKSLVAVDIEFGYYEHRAILHADS